MVTVRRRIATVFLLVAIYMVFLGGRLGYLQIVQYSRYRELALSQRLRPIPVDARRGTIFDRNMVKLAVSISADAVYAVPVEVKDKKATAAALAPLLRLSEKDIVEKLSERQETVWIRRKIDAVTSSKVRELNLPGIGLVERPQRFYPNSKLAAHALGIAGVDNQGLEGLELYYDKFLRGVEGRIEAERDAVGREIPFGISKFVPPEDGADLILTIDQVIQYRAEQELDKMVAESQSDFGMFIAVAPQTGEILALAVSPSFDPNSYDEFPNQNRRNRAVTDQFEPGSTFKIVTGSSGLDEGAVKPDDVFFDPGTLLIGGGSLSCWNTGGHGSLSFVEATESSCNVAFATIAAQRLGSVKFYKYITAYGIGSQLGIDFPGEGTGSVPKPGTLKWGELLQWANIGFGQGVAVTPLQLVMAQATIANNGVLMRPHLMKEIRDRSGRTLVRYKPTPIRQVLSQQTAQTFSTILRSVVVNGSGKRADIPGYRVAGKTGTAEIPEKGQYTDKTIASFVGFAPVDNPAIAALVMLYDVKVHPKWGGLRAAPVFKTIVEDALEHLQVERRYEPEVHAPAGPDGKTTVVMPNVKNLSLDEAREVLGAAGLKIRVDGVGTIVIDQMPKSGAQVDEGTTAVLHFDASVEYNEKSGVTVPNLAGMTRAEAAAALADVGLRMAASGTGNVTKQVPPAGTRVLNQSTIEVSFGSADGGTASGAAGAPQSSGTAQPGATEDEAVRVSPIPGP